MEFSEEGKNRGSAKRTDVNGALGLPHKERAREETSQGSRGPKQRIFDDALSLQFKRQAGKQPCSCSRCHSKNRQDAKKVDSQNRANREHIANVSMRPASRTWPIAS